MLYLLQCVHELLNSTKYALKHLICDVLNGIQNSNTHSAAAVVAACVTLKKRALSSAIINFMQSSVLWSKEYCFAYVPHRYSTNCQFASDVEQSRLLVSGVA